MMDISEQTRIEDIYKKIPLEKIPWNSETPPPQLVELVNTGRVKACKAIDLGCGAGNYAIYLAGRGFDVTGVDLSPTAIKLAGQNATAKKVKCGFFVADIITDLDKFKQTWDFAYDWGLLHHIFPQHRKKYVENVFEILKTKGRYLSVCFSEQDNAFAGKGKYRKSKLGTILYFSSEDELKKLFEQHFQIIDLQTLEIEGKFGPHIFNYVFMEKK